MDTRASRPPRWSRLRLPRPRPLDIVWAAFVALLVVLGAGTAFPDPAWTAPATGFGVVWGLLYVLPLLWRRADADLAALALVPAHLIQLALTNWANPANVTVPLMMFTVAAYGRVRYRLWWLGFGTLAALVAALDWTIGSAIANARNGFPLPASEQANLAAVAFIGLASVVSASWAIGAFARARNEASASARDARAAQTLQHRQAVQLAATQERQRLAREMHDVVAHSLAVIVVQADGGAYAAGMAGDPTLRLATAEKALTTVRDTARDALTETRRLVGVLRSDQPTELTPASGLGDIFGLVQGLADAGRDVRMEVTGDPGLRRLLSPGLELAVFRIVQEALTNAVKHAGDAASVLVHLHHAPHELVVQVRDNGVGSGPTDGLGHGLVGMRERVAAFGGTLAAHDHPDGGFVVTARFPTPQGDPR